MKVRKNIGFFSRSLEVLQWVCRFNFGNFETEEFKKFLRMGIIFFLIIGVYWTLRAPLKDAVFISLCSSMELPYVKTASVLFMVPIVMVYTKLLGMFAKERVLVIVPAFYGITILVLSLLIFFVQALSETISDRSLVAYWGTKVLGYFWYVFVESFGSLIPALFWAFASDSTDPATAKRGFPLVYVFGQLGGIIFPYTIGSLPHRLGFTTDAFSMAILGILMLLIIPAVRYFLRNTPAALLVPFRAENETKPETPQEPGFFEGLKLIFRHRYLMGLFIVNFVYEVIITIFDFNFKIAAGQEYSGVALSRYLSLYGSSVNMISFACLILGVSNIIRYLGAGVALLITPVIIGAALFGFLKLESLSFLFILMVGSKGINYALYGPSLKQLYIPTTSEVRFKALTWIETFGSRTAKEGGSIINMLLSFFQKTFGVVAGRTYYLILSGVIGSCLVLIGFCSALYLGKKFKDAIESKKIIC